jgi:ATP-dependent DNA helicase RecQ
MVEYAETPGCRRAVILRYFGEQPGERCEHCDNCTDGYTAQEEAYPLDLFDAVLSLRTGLAEDSNRPPYMVFEERTAREIATYRPHSEDDLLRCWGLGATRVRWFGNRLLSLVLEWERTHPEGPPPGRRPIEAGKGDDGPEGAFDDPLFQRLRAWRRDRSRSEGVPAYTVFTDRTARELAARRPRDPEALRSVYGMGDARVRAFGEELLEVIGAPDSAS